MVAVAVVLQRAGTVWTPGTVPYSQSTLHMPDGYRQDCSGYVSMCWTIPLHAPGSWGGMNTVNLVTDRVMTEIPISDLQPGDAIGLCGPGTAGDDGHIQLVEAVTATGLVIWEQAGGVRGPVRRTIKRPTPGYKAYRYQGIADGPTTVEDDMPKFFRVDQDGRMGVTDGPTWYHLESDAAVDAALRIWGQTRANIIAINEHDLAGCGQQVTEPSAGGGSGPTLAQIEQVVDKQLDQAFGGGADKD
jgi:hypothetical protein